MTSLVLIGAGGHARVVLELIRASNVFEVVGMLDPKPSAEAVLGIPVLGGDEMLPGLMADGVRHAFVALGENRVRRAIAARLASQGFVQPALYHPSAEISPSARTSPGSLIMARAVLGTESLLGDGAILNTGAIADHDNRLCAYCHVAPGCALAGNVTIGERTLVGIGASIRPGIRVGSDCVIGAGAAVVADLADGATVIGVPARTLKRA